MENNIVYFDGVCNLCNSLLHFLMKYDSDKNLLFSWSKSDYAILTLPKNVLEYTDTSIIFYRNGNFYKKVQNGFIKLAGKNNRKYQIINSNLDIELNKLSIIKKVEKLIR